MLLLGACSDEHAGTLPPPSPTTGAPTTPTPSATGDYATGLRAAIDAYYRTLSEAARDPANRTDALAQLIHPSCTCMAVIDFLRKEAAEGHYLDYSYSARDIRVIDVGELGGNATYVVVQTPGHQRARDGRVLATFPGSEQKFSVHFRRLDGRWLLDRADRVK